MIPLLEAVPLLVGSGPEARVGEVVDVGRTLAVGVEVRRLPRHGGHAQLQLVPAQLQLVPRLRGLGAPRPLRMRRARPGELRSLERGLE